jgi:hypothetical protein
MTFFINEPPDRLQYWLQKLENRGELYIPLNQTA